MEIKDAAIAKLKAMLAGSGKSGFLRVFLTEGCRGPSLAMDLVDKPGEGDLEVSKGDFKVYVDKAAGTPLGDAVMDCDAGGEIIVKGLPEPEGGCDCGCGH